MRLLVSPTFATLAPSTIGLGQYAGQSTALQTGETVASIAATGITTTTSILGALGSTMTVLGLSLPVVGTAIAALVGVGIAIANCFKGCGQTCIQATQYANQADSILEQNVDAYTSSPIRYVSMQQAALNTFDTAWAALQQACGQPALGQAGVNCITDRQAGSCKWKASPGGWNQDGTYTKWGPAGSGSACWNWFSGMRDPIANDPFVQPDPVALGSIGNNSSITGTTGTVASTSTTTNLIQGVANMLSSSLQLGGLNVPLWVLAAVSVVVATEVKK